MAISELAGKLAPEAILTNIPLLLTKYYEVAPDMNDPAQQVSFGTSGHRGSSLDGSFTERHIFAISQAVAEHRASAGIHGPLFIGADTHALSEPALASALRVLVANGVDVRRSQGGAYTPTPLISRAILDYNRGEEHHIGQADGIVITPSHNPPQDGGFKYNPPSGGPADTDVTRGVQNRANDLLRGGNAGVKLVSYAEAMQQAKAFDFITPYVEQLPSIVDLDAIREAGINIGVDPLGGSSLPVWEAVKERWNLKLTIVNRKVDPMFAFMTVDKDGKIRMDCSSPYAMASLLALKDDFDVAIGNDPDADRHGIVTPDGLMNPNHYLAVAIHYLFANRPHWPALGGRGQDPGLEQLDR